MDTWGEDLAIFIPKSMHEAKMLPGRGLIARIRGKGDAYGAILASWALGPPQCKEGMRGFMGRRGGWRGWRVAALGQATQRVAASAERARRAAGLAGAADAAVVGAAVQGRRWWARRCGCCVRGGATVRGHGAAADATLVTALELTAQQARWKRATVGREESGLARRNTPARVAAIRPNWRALPQRALRALR